MKQQTTAQSAQQKLAYPSYLDLLTQEQFTAFEKGIRLARQEKTAEALTYFNDLVRAHVSHPNMLTACCIVVADLGKEADADASMLEQFESHKNSGMYLCGIARIQLVENKLEEFEKTFELIKVWLKEHEPKAGAAERSRDEELEYAVVFAEASYLSVRYCIAKKILGQAAYLIREYEALMPDHEMFVALKVFLAHALQKGVPEFKLPPKQEDFEPFMNHVIDQIIEQNMPKQQEMEAQQQQQ